ncbi:MAG: GspH/FimT family pseudopilin [Lentisphaerae bacterium]|nr:GspH/FimT family pseudopilin [Lentisphaerota bacterium]
MSEPSHKPNAVNRRTAPPGRDGRRAGFTYFEVMIVVGILAIVVASSSMYMRGTMPRYRIRDAADRLQAQLRAARLHAISHVRTVSLTLDLANKRLRTDVDEDGDGTIASNETATIQLSSTAALSLTSSSTYGTFNPRGDFITSNGYWRVVISHAGATPQYVYVFQAGHVQASEVSLD